MPVVRSELKSVLTALRAAAGQRNNPVAGIVWVTLSMMTLAGLGAFAKAAANSGVHPFQIVFFRNVFATLVFLPLLYTRGASVFETGQLSLYGWRCLVALLSMLAWFTGLSLIPLGELTAISFLAPLFGTLGAIFFLGEKVRGRRWTAMAVGFLGAMIILRPGISPMGLGQVLAVMAAITAGMSGILVKQLTNRDDPNRIVFLTHAILIPMSLIPALFVWQWPPLSTLPLLLGMGICATLGHISLVRGYAATDASLVMTFEFSKLPFATIIGYFVFGELTDRWTWVGALVIFASAVYIARREAQVRHEASKDATTQAGTGPA
jgi:drug/metabolite transporter (DMT)-like permease